MKFILNFNHFCQYIQEDFKKIARKKWNIAASNLKSNFPLYFFLRLLALTSSGCANAVQRSWVLASNHQQFVSELVDFYVQTSHTTVMFMVMKDPVRFILSFITDSVGS